MSVIVRPATPGDMPAIKTMMREMMDYLNAIAEPMAIDPAMFDRAEAAVFGAEGFCGLLMAEAEAAPAGYLMHHRGLHMDTVTPALHVVDLFVRDAARGTGVGRALMDAAAALVRERGGRTLYWTVWDKNPRALAFYEHLGARRFTEEILMEWRLEVE